MNIRPKKKPLLEEEEDTPTTQRTVSLEWITEQVRKHPNDVGLRFGKARAHMKKQEWDDARRELEEVLALDPDQGSAWRYLSVVEKMRGNNEGVVKCYEQLEVLGVYDIETLCEHGRSLLRLGRFPEAQGIFDSALEMDETSPDAWAGRSEALRLSATTCLPHDEPDSLDEETAADIEEGYEAALEADPANLQAIQGFAEWQFHQQRHQESLKSVETALGIAPDSPRNWEQKARILERFGDEAGAIDSFKKAAESPLSDMDEGEPVVLYSKANALEKVGDSDSALRCLEKIMDIDITNQQALMKKADILSSMGKNEEASEAYDQLLELRPRDHYLWYLKGDTEKKAKKFERALVSYDHSITEKPDFIPAVRSKGETLYKMGRLEEGKEIVESLLNLNPEDTDALKLRDVIHAQLKNNQAQHASQRPSGKEAKSNPNRMNGHQKLSTGGTSAKIDIPSAITKAKRFLEEGKASEAAVILEECPGATNENWEILSLMGDCYRRENREDDALRAYKEAMALNPNNISLYTSAAQIQFSNNDLFGALDTIRSFPDSDDKTVRRAEIEIEAELLVKNIRSAVGILRGEEQDASNIYGGEDTRPTTKREQQQRVSEKRTVKKERGLQNAAEQKLSEEHLLELRGKIERSLGENPGDDLLWYARGLVSYQMGDMRGAISSMDKAIRINPKRKKYWEAKAELFMFCGKEDLAQKCNKKALELSAVTEDNNELDTIDVVEYGIDIDVSKGLVPLEGSEEYGGPPPDVNQTEHAVPESGDKPEKNLVRSGEQRQKPEENSEAAGHSTESAEPESSAQQHDSAEVDVSDVDVDLGAWGNTLMDQWNSSDFIAFDCPQCDSTIVEEEKTCGKCGLEIVWDTVKVTEDAFFDDLFFFDKVREIVSNGRFSEVIFDYVGGRVFLFLFVGDNRYRVERWEGRLRSSSSGEMKLNGMGIDA